MSDARNSNSEWKKVAEKRQQSWAENYRARRSEAGQHVAEARAESQVVKSERSGQSL